MKVNKVGKRVLSVVLCLVMLFTTFCVFDIGSLMSSAADATYVPYKSAVLVAPEAIYLTPKSDGSTSNFQYFINNSDNGTPSADKATSGSIYFNYPNATSASLSVSGNVSVSYSSGFSGSNGTYRATISNSSTSSYASSYITWTVTYTDATDGQTKTITAKTYVYAPFIGTSAVSAQSERRQLSGFRYKWARAGVTAMIYGIHTIEATDTDLYCEKTEVENRDGDYTLKLGYMNRYPLCEDSTWSSFEFHSDSVPSVFTESTNTTGLNAGYRLSYTANNKAATVNLPGGRGGLYVDTSRYATFDQIPNFTVRSDFNGVEGSLGSEAGQYTAKIHTRLGLAQNPLSEGTRTEITFASGQEKSTNPVTCKVSAETLKQTLVPGYDRIPDGNSTVLAEMYANATAKGTSTGTNVVRVYTACNIYGTNKSALRSEIKTSVAEMPIICANGTSVSAFNTALSNAYDNLTKLDASMSVDTSALVSARQTLENETVTNLRNKLAAKINEATNIRVLGSDALTAAFNTALAAAQTAANTYASATYSLANVNGINKALFDLTQAINNLTACDTSALQKAYKDATAKVEEHYTTTSWAPLAAALADSDVVFMLNTTSKFYAAADYIAAKTEAITTAVAGLQARWNEETLDVSVPMDTGCTMETKTAAGAPYRIYTVEAPLKNAEGQAFSWWADASGKVVSTYRNYTFYGCTATNLTPVYGRTGEIKDNYAIMRVVGFRNNNNRTDTGIYSIMVERSINRQLTKDKSGLVAHGVIYADTQAKIEAINGTTDPSTLGGNGVYVTSAKSTATIGNGLFEVRAAASTLPVGGTVYIRPYALINDTYYYFDIVSYEVGAITGASEDADTIDVCADTVEYAVVQNEDKADVPAEDPTVDVPVVDEPTVEEPTSETSWFDMIVAWFKDLINVLISSIIGLF